MGTALDPSGLLAGTREVYWWAARRASNQTRLPDTVVALVRLSDDRGAMPSGFRRALLDAWAVASRHEHDLLRLGFPEYAGAILMWQMGGHEKVAALLDALEADVADIRDGIHRRSTFRPVPHA